MGFNQRQAGGKFTTEEADAFIDQLQTAEHQAATAESGDRESGTQESVSSPPPPETAAPTAAPTVESMTEAERAVRTASTKSLVLEVRRRGWTVTKPKT